MKTLLLMDWKDWLLIAEHTLKILQHVLEVLAHLSGIR